MNSYLNWAFVDTTFSCIACYKNRSVDLTLTVGVKEHYFHFSQITVIVNIPRRFHSYCRIKSSTGNQCGRGMTEFAKPPEHFITFLHQLTVISLRLTRLQFLKSLACEATSVITAFYD